MLADWDGHPLELDECDTKEFLEKQLKRLKNKLENGRANAGLEGRTKASVSGTWRICTSPPLPYAHNLTLPLLAVTISTHFSPLSSLIIYSLILSMFLCCCFIDRFEKATADLQVHRNNEKDIKGELEAMEVSIETRKETLKKQLKKYKKLVKTKFRLYMSRKGFAGEAIFGPPKRVQGPKTLNLVGLIHCFRNPLTLIFSLLKFHPLHIVSNPIALPAYLLHPLIDIFSAINHSS